MAIVEVWKSEVAKSQHLNHSKTTTCKEKCYISERNGGGKLTDVTSFFRAFLSQKQRKHKKILNKIIMNKMVGKAIKNTSNSDDLGVEAYGGIN